MKSNLEKEEGRRVRKARGKVTEQKERKVRKEVQESEGKDGLVPTSTV